MTTLLAGIGSPHAADQLGWQAVQQLASRLPATIRVLVLADPLLLLEELTGVDRLILIDACQADQLAGTVLRFDWPCSDLSAQWGTSSHGIDLPAVLQLADQLGRLPRRVILFGIVVGEGEDSDPLARALPALWQSLQNEVGA